MSPPNQTAKIKEAKSQLRQSTQMNEHQLDVVLGWLRVEVMTVEKIVSYAEGLWRKVQELGEEI